MKKRVREQKLPEIASVTKESVEKTLNSLKKQSLILNYATKITPKGNTFNIMCTIILPENKVFYFEIDYLYDRKGLFKKENALKTILLIGQRILTKGLVPKVIRKGIKRRSNGLKKELVVGNVFLPQAKKEKLILDFEKTNKEDDMKGSDFNVFIKHQGEIKKISFDLKSSKFYQRIHAIRHPNISSIAIVQETTYEEFKNMLMFVISEVCHGRSARARDKRCPH